MEQQFKVGEKFTLNMTAVEKEQYATDGLSVGTQYQVTGLNAEYRYFIDDDGDERLFPSHSMERIKTDSQEPLTQESMIIGLKEIFDTALPLATLEDLEKLWAYMDDMSGLVGAEIKKREEEANRFKQEDYERVVQQLRSQPGRKKFEGCADNFCIDFNSETMKTNVGSWFYTSGGLFQVYFESADLAAIALMNVGAENIIKAAIFESEIGL